MAARVVVDRDGSLTGRAMVERAATVAVLLGGYWIVFPILHRLIGNPSFLLGLAPCLVAGALLGIRGAVVAVLLVVLMDRQAALALAGPETSIPAAVIAGLVKLILAGGLGLVVDSRRRLHAANRRLEHEIEARRESEESLRASEQLHRALVESLGEGVGLFDAEDRLVFANQALADTLESIPERLRGRRFKDFLVEPGREKLTDHTPGGSHTYEAALRTNASTLLLVTETALEPGLDGAALTLRVVRDLTERVVSERRQRDLEREIQRGQALQSLAVLAGGVAHDFNNLLSGVVGNVELAQRKLPPTSPPQLAQCLAEIKTFADEAAQLSRQMLAYAGRRSLAIEATDTNAEVRDALRLLHATIDSKARLVLELRGDLPEIAADRFQLRQVLTNLVLNALEAMPGARGRLTIRTETCRLEQRSPEYAGLAPGSYVRISVQDTGVGIDPEVTDRIFEPFFSTKSAGRGMGLAAAVGIVRAHRGWLGIRSASSAGTTFDVLLPVARTTTPRRSSPPARTLAPPVARNILLIDDEPAVRLVTGRLLAELGQRVLTAESGTRGLDVFSKQGEAIDLVLLDLTMPELSGEEVLDELRRLRRDVRVVITSGFHPADASELLSAPNVVGFLEKPHTLTNLEVLLASTAPTPTAGASLAALN